MMGGVEPQHWRESAGALLRQARIARRLSKRKAAGRAGFSEALWRQLEEGGRQVSGIFVAANPRDDTLEAAARAVDLDPAVLFEAAGRQYDGPTLHPTQDDHEARLQAVEKELAYLKEHFARPDEIDLVEPDLDDPYEARIWSLKKGFPKERDRKAAIFIYRAAKATGEQDADIRETG